ncbi:MAG: phosphatidylserine decarboxylase [Thermoplasmatales archaeon]|nr:MAG: phosphatidylserine decarboxylase [Thermoplasmatales archaeon]
MKIAKGGLYWIIPSFLVTLFFIVLTIYVNEPIKYVILFIFILALLISFVLLIFFRDPERKIGKGIVAVADGVVREITKENDKDVGKSIKISTFMNIYNVHVNRMPIDGVIKEITHHDGAYILAFKKESEKNERIILLLKTNIGSIKIIQIAGTLARRIVPYVKKGDNVRKGEKIGLIRLGSRVDIYLPTKKIKPITVKVKDKLQAGEDTIAEVYD